MKRLHVFAVWRAVVMCSGLWLWSGWLQGQDPVVHETFYPSGQIATRHTTVGGIWQGPYTAWYENGNLKEEGAYASGLKQGWWKRWYEGGGPWDEQEYDRGMREGDYRLYSAIPDCSLIQSGTYAEGREDGLWLEYNCEGQIVRETEYDRGQKGKIVSLEWHANGRMKKRYEMRNGQREGPWQEWYDTGQLRYDFFYEANWLSGLQRTWFPNGVLNLEENYRNGELDGSRRTWDEGGRIREERTYRSGRLHGRRVWWLWIDGVTPRLQRESYDRNGQAHGPWSEWKYEYEASLGGMVYYLWERQDFRDNALHGESARYFPNGRTQRILHYSNGVLCGWERLWKDMFSDQLERELWHGACQPLEEDEAPYPPPLDDDGNARKEIRGHVHEAVTGAPVTGASVKAEGASATTGVDGFYCLTVGEADSVRLECEKTGYKPVSLGVDLTGLQYKTENLRLAKADPSAPNKPSIQRVVSRFGDIFLSGIDVSNPFVVSVDWNGPVGQVRFARNGNIEMMPGTDEGVIRNYNMASDYISSVAPDANRLSITAVNGLGIESDPHVLHPIVIPAPRWLLALGVMNVKFDKHFNLESYLLERAWPEDPFSLEINEATVGSRLWGLWKLVPYFGGEEFGITNSQAKLELEFKTDGVASGLLGGQTGIQAGGLFAEGRIGGKVEGKYVPGVGLEQIGGAFILDIPKVGLRRLFKPTSIVPGLTTAENWPVIGSAVKWFNQRAEVEAWLYLGAGFELGIVKYEDPPGLGWPGTKGSFGEGASATLNITLGNNVKASVGGSVDTRTHWRVPAQPDYIEKLSAEGNVAVEFQAWGRTRRLTYAPVWEYPDPGLVPAAPLTAVHDTGFQPVPRAFLQRAPYNISVGSRTPAPASVRFGGEDVALVDNVYPYAEPVLGVSSNQLAYAYVYLDPGDPPSSATEICASFETEGVFGAPAPIANDTRGEFSPTLAFDQTGRAVAVWERVKAADLSDTAELEDIAPRLEIVFATRGVSDAEWSIATALSDNDHLDYAPQLARSSNGALALAWLSHAENALMGTAQSPTDLHFARWDAATAAFSSVQTLPRGLARARDFRLAWDGAQAAVVYVQEPDPDVPTTGTDSELCHVTYDGSQWSAPRQLTDNTVDDENPQLLVTDNSIPILLWQQGDRIVQASNWQTDSPDTVRPNSAAAGFLDFLVVQDFLGHMALVWTAHGENGGDLFARVYDPADSSWSDDLRLTDAAGLEHGTTAAFTAESRLHLLFNRTSPETGLVALRHWTRSLGYDLAMTGSSLSLDPETAGPGDAATLRCRVENRGELAIAAAQVSFYLGDPRQNGLLLGIAPVQPISLRGGAFGQAVLDWTIPTAGDPGAIHAVVEAPAAFTDRDPLNNSASFRPLRYELAVVTCRLEPLGDGSWDAIAVVANNGRIAAPDVVVLFQIEGLDLALVRIPALLPGLQAEVSQTFWPDVEGLTANRLLTARIDPYGAFAERDRSDNEASTAATHLSDIDADGMEDDWEQRFFGHLLGDGSLDSDGDSHRDGEEAIAGTDPTDPSDCLAVRLAEAEPSGGTLTLRWRTAPGRVYRVEASDALGPPSWVEVDRVEGDGLEAQWAHSTSASGACYLRVRVERGR